MRDYTAVVQCTDGTVWFGVILWYEPPMLSWRRRQHDALRSLVFWFNVRFPTTLTIEYAVVRGGEPLNHKLCPAPRPGVARG